MSKTRERLIAVDKDQSSLLFARHVAAYIFSTRYCKDKRVMDLGCGDGYGARLLCDYANEVVGLDMDEETIMQAKKQYATKNSSFIVGNAECLPAHKKFDVIVSFQLIEHIHDTEQYLLQIKNALKKDGCAILTTPNRQLRLADNQKPWNIFHVTEYSKKSLYSLLSLYFESVEIRGMTARKNIYTIEVKRLQIRRLISRIDLFNLYQFIPKELSDMVLELLRKIKRGKKVTSVRVSPSDFYVTNSNVNLSLDLIAICRKSRT